MVAARILEPAPVVLTVQPAETDATPKPTTHRPIRRVCACCRVPTSFAVTEPDGSLYLPNWNWRSGDVMFIERVTSNVVMGDLDGVKDKSPKHEAAEDRILQGDDAERPMVGDLCAGAHAGAGTAFAGDVSPWDCRSAVERSAYRAPDGPLGSRSLAAPCRWGGKLSKDLWDIRREANLLRYAGTTGSIVDPLRSRRRQVPAPETPERAAEGAREFAKAARASLKKNLATWRQAPLAQQQAIVRKHVAHLFSDRFGVEWKDEWSRWYTAPAPASVQAGASPRSRLLYWLDRRPPFRLPSLGTIELDGPTPQDRFWSQEEFTWTSLLCGNWPLRATTSGPHEVLQKETEAIKKALAKFGQSSTGIQIRRGPRVCERSMQKDS